MATAARGLESFAMTVPTSPQQALDPALLMQGFPPPPAYRVNAGNWQQWPQKIWSFQHAAELFGTRTITRAGPVTPLPQRPTALDDLPVPLVNAGATTWGQMLVSTHCDAVLVLHRGQVVHERYFNGMQPQTPHLLFSATKSMAGLMAATCVAEGLLDDGARVDSVIPELSGSAWGGATVRQVMDMTDGVDFSEDYVDERSDIFGYVAAVGWLPGQGTGKGATPIGICDNLVTHRRLHPQARGSAFRYRSPATDVTAWLAQRAAQQSVSAWLQQRLWQPLGMEADASLMLDPTGTEICFAGLSATTRDVARLGQLLLQRGQHGGAQLLPAAVVDDLVRGGSSQAFAQGGFVANNPAREGWSYRSQWWVDPRRGFFAAMGAFGQRLFVCPEHNAVLVFFGSHPQPVAARIDELQLPAIHTLLRHLERLPP